jgi:hypothetical protein
VTLPGSVHDEARELRQDGLTIDEIAVRLAISRSTAYAWVGEIDIPRTSRQSAAQRLGSARNAENALARRAAAYEMGYGEFDDLVADAAFRDFVSMYIGEGYKRDRNVVALGNSDPVVVSLAARFVTAHSTNRISYGLQYHADQDPDWLREFWGFRLSVDPVRVTLQRKSNSGGLRGRRWRCRHGVLTVRTSDTALRSRLQGWMDAMKDSWVPG